MSLPMEVGETEMVQSLLEGKAQFLGQQKPKRGSGEVGRKQIDKFHHDSTWFNLFWSILYANMQWKVRGIYQISWEYEVDWYAWSFGLDWRDGERFTGLTWFDSFYCFSHAFEPPKHSPIHPSVCLPARTPVLMASHGGHVGAATSDSESQSWWSKCIVGIAKQILAKLSAEVLRLLLKSLQPRSNHKSCHSCWSVFSPLPAGRVFLCVFCVPDSKNSLTHFWLARLR